MLPSSETQDFKKSVIFLLHRKGQKSITSLADSYNGNSRDQKDSHQKATNVFFQAISFCNINYQIPKTYVIIFCCC